MNEDNYIFIHLEDLMSRSTQFIGHTSEVRHFLVSCIGNKKIGEVTGMFSEHIHDLYEYIDPHGNTWKEFEQVCPWSSGPMIFLAIRNKETGEIMGWKEEPRDHETVDYTNGIYWV